MGSWMDGKRLLAAAMLAVTAMGCGTGGNTEAEDAEREPLGSEAEDSVAISTDAETSCVETYDRTTLDSRAFAFDGTVTNIGDRVGAGDDYLEVTFEVHEWFRGAGPSEIAVQMWPPAEVSSVEVSSVEMTTYETGTRLLVAGEPRWDGEPLESPVAWACGFTRTHSDEVADTWRAVLDASDG